jgi:hypothetical protein
MSSSERSCAGTVAAQDVPLVQMFPVCTARWLTTPVETTAGPPC